MYLSNDALCFFFLLRVKITRTTNAIKHIIITAMTTPTIAGMRFELEEDEALAMVEGGSSSAIAIRKISAVDTYDTHAHTHTHTHIHTHTHMHAHVCAHTHTRTHTNTHTANTHIYIYTHIQ